MDWAELDAVSPTVPEINGHLHCLKDNYFAHKK